MKKIFLLFISIFVILSNNTCNPNIPDVFWLPEKVESFIITMDYGNPKGDRYPGYSLHPELTVDNSSLCLHSRSPLVVDYGPRLSVCIPVGGMGAIERRQIYENWERAIHSALRMGSVRGLPNFETRTNHTSIHFEFLTESALRNLWKTEVPKSYFLGDLRLKRFLGVDSDLSWNGEQINITRYYGAPYWNYWEGKDCSFLFSTWDIGMPANQRRILKIRMDCSITSDLFRKFFDRVETVNNNEISNCLKEDLELTEIFSHTESDFGRFLEFQNSKNRSNCRNEFHIASTHLDDSHPHSSSGTDLGVRYKGDWEFLFPGATVLLAPKDSNLDSYEWEEEYQWTPISQGNLGIDGVNIASWNRFTGFRYEDEFTSWRENPYPCSMKETFYVTDERFCGSPGNQEKWTVDPGVYCSEKNIYLTEANFWGIQNSFGELDPRDRFLEFYYSGGENNQTCDLSSLWLDWETQRVPLFVPSVDRSVEWNDRNGNSLKPNKIMDGLLNPGDIFLVSLSPNLPRDTKKFSRNLFTLNSNRSIRIGSFLTKSPSTENLGKPFNDSSKWIYNPRRNFLVGNLTIVPSDESGSLYSIVFPDSMGYMDRTIIQHHPSEEFPFWSSRKNYMSPGRLPQAVPFSFMGNAEASNLNNSNTNLQITEILWMGSYHLGQSVFSDRFFEWRNPQARKDSFYLSIEYSGFPGRRQNYLIPLSGDEFGFISSGNSVCFPGSLSIHSNTFRLFHNNARFQIHSIDGRLEDSFDLDTSIHGLNNTTDRIRRSAVKDLTDGTWSSNANPSSVCAGETFASPGSGNL